MMAGLAVPLLITMPGASVPVREELWRCRALDVFLQLLRVDPHQVIHR
jgi:hypothetical protein